MSLKQLNKTGLLQLIQRLHLDEEGTKPILEERLAEYFDNHPELEEDEEFKKYIQFRQRTSPKKVTEIPSQAARKPVLNSSPSKFLSIANRFRHADSSPSKEPAKDTEEDEEEDDDDEDDDDDEGSESDESQSDDDGEEIELISQEKDDDFDPEYKPSKFEFVTKIQDWYIAKSEEGTEYIKEKLDDIKYSVTKQSADLRKSLSSAESVSLLIIAAELNAILYQEVPVIQLRQAPFLNQKILARYENIINLKWPIWDFSVFAQFKFLSVLFTWTLLSVIIPLIGSYYFNFIAKKFKKSKFDPLVFNLFKFLLAFLFLYRDVSFNDVKNTAEGWAAEHGLLESRSFIQNVREHFFHDSITLRLILGDFPFVGASVGILVALYAAAI